MVREDPVVFFPLPSEVPKSSTKTGPLLAPLSTVEPAFVLQPVDEDNGARIERLLAGSGLSKRHYAWPASVTGLPNLSVPTVSSSSLFTAEGQNHVPETAESPDPVRSLWDFASQPDDRAGSSHIPEVKTWDDPTDKGVNPFLSEQLPPTFESLLSLSDPPINLPNLRTPEFIPAADAKSLLDLMTKATLGTTLSDVLRWNGREGRFVYTSTAARPEGVERRTAASLMDEFLMIGSGIRRLEIIIEEHNATPITPTHHALLHALATVVTFVLQTLTTIVQDNAAEPTALWLERTSALASIRELVTELCHVVCWPLSQAKPIGLPARPSSVLSHLHAILFARLSTSNVKQKQGYATVSLAFLLSHASQPFLHTLHQWVGLADSSDADNDKDLHAQPWKDLGITRTPSSLVDEEDIRWDYTFSGRRMPAFVPKDIRRTLFEAGRGLRALRRASAGQHPLCSTDWSIKGSWGWGPDDNAISHDLRLHSRRVYRAIEKWRGKANTRHDLLSRSSTGSLRFAQSRERPPIPGDFMSSSQSPSAVPVSTFDELWSAFHPSLESQSTKTSQLWTPTPVGDLQEFFDWHSDPSHPLLPADSPTLELYVSTHLLAPLLAHATIMSRALTQLYLDDLHFLDHLDVLRAFWLGGDAGFMERVGGALFGKDQAGAGDALGMGRRARTRARLGLDETATIGGNEGEWGIGLGLGLSDRQRWPPGGAELAYALRTTLLDDEIHDFAPRGEVWEEIEDRVSFAVKALPEDDRDGRRARWLNPQAIEALDFLYLVYSPPDSIGVLLPHSIMEKYQLINNFLLKLSRVETVARTLYFDVVRPVPPVDGHALKVGIDATYNKPPSKVGLRSRQVAGIFETNSEAEHTLFRLRFAMSWFISVLSRYVLDTAIGHNWDVMRRRLEKLQKHTHRSTSIDSRPITPSVADDDYEDLDNELSEAGAEEDDDVTTALGALSQLQSAHSLVLYHHIILNRILRACLLYPQPGHQVTLKVLMAMLGMILDLGKLLKDIGRGAVTVQEGAEQISVINLDWAQKQAILIHALERLSLRTSSKSSAAQAADVDGTNATEHEGDAHDLQLLLEGERDSFEEWTEGDGGTRAHLGHSSKQARLAPGAMELQELVLRLKLGQTRSGAQ